VVLVPIESGLSGEAWSPLGFCAVDSWTSNGIKLQVSFSNSPLRAEEYQHINTTSRNHSKPTTELYKNNILNTSRNINSWSWHHPELLRHPLGFPTVLLGQLSLSSVPVAGIHNWSVKVSGHQHYSRCAASQYCQFSPGITMLAFSNADQYLK
jgi:hypothetical protein